MTRAVGRALGMLSIRRRLVGSPVALAQFCQSGKGVTTRLAGGMVGTFEAHQSQFHVSCKYWSQNFGVWYMEEAALGEMLTGGRREDRPGGLRGRALILGVLTVKKTLR